ncbi:MAG TPA: chemotaxis protein CheW [Burkholderiaceae bacterium]
MDIHNDSATRQEHGPGVNPSPTGEYLTCRIGAEEYGIDIQKVQEIRSFEMPTRIANAPHFVKGVINLRGVIVPIVDLRIKLGCDAADYTDITVVVVLNVCGHVVGAVVDSVSDVIDLEAEAIQPPPELSAGEGGFITGIASVGERMLIMVDIESLLGGAEIGLAGTAVQ